MSATSAAEPNKKTMQVIYPQYIDSNVPPREGRRVSLQHAVSSPNVNEIAEALKALGYSSIHYDRDRSLPCAQSQARMNPAPKGCLRVAIKTPSDEHYIRKSEFDTNTRGPVVASVPNKNRLLIKICEYIKRKHGEGRVAKVPPTAVEFAQQVQEAYDKMKTEQEGDAKEGAQKGKIAGGKKK